MGNQYQKLMSNTVLFAIGTFSSKLLRLLIDPIVTRKLDPAVMSGATNAISICDVILPMMYLCISEGIIRYGLERGTKKSDIFTTGMLTVLGGYLVFLILFPLLCAMEGFRSYVAGYEWLVRLFVLASAMRTVVSHFVRASGMVRIFALDGMVTSFTTILFTLVFVFGLDWGGAGYMLATVCADALSALSMMVMLKLPRFLKPFTFDKDIAKKMLRYSIPLVPTAVFWWVTNLSDRFFVTTICGAEANGVYFMASKLPSIIVSISAIFIQAWQISAFTSYKGEKGRLFFSNVFKSYYSMIFLAASGLILVIRPVTKFMVEEAYYVSWKYALFLMLAMSFSCLVTFLGTIYNAVQKNAMVTVTTLVGAAVNLLLNALLIPLEGPFGGPVGAALATFISFVVVFVIRAVDTRKYIRIDMQPLRIAASLALLLAQIYFSMTQPKFGVLWQVLLFLGLVLCNLGYLWFMAKKLIHMVLPKGRRT